MAEGPTPTPDRLLLLEAQDSPGLGPQLTAFGYQVTEVPDPESLVRQLALGDVQALVVDLEAMGADATLETLAPVLEARHPGVRLLVRARLGDLPTQVKAIRMGCDAFFSEPVELQVFTDKLDALLHPPEPERIRVLIVEDSRTLAMLYAKTLEDAGMDTRAVTDPMKALDALAEFRPDLVLMDMYMPGCTGLELAAALRMNPGLLSLPIVYLSAETDTQKQLSALLKGGDDFLTKPIEPDHLIAAVRARAERTRLLRNLMVRDSLTGLFNHSTLKQRLGEELSRSQRTQAPLAFAMVDIDHFKKVNDTHGHPTGDRVILSLARLLQRRLRKSDVVGRYGGEEFAVLLPDTALDGAVRALDQLRQDFARIQHHGPQEAFHCSFSCGVAACPPLAETKALGDAADAALYEAKRGGRNRVVPAS